MHPRIDELAGQAFQFAADNADETGKGQLGVFADKFAELLLKDVAELNKMQGYELDGVLIDTEDGEGFDTVCLNTVKRVNKYLDLGIAQHYGIKP